VFDLMLSDANFSLRLTNSTHDLGLILVRLILKGRRFVSGFFRLQELLPNGCLIGDEGEMEFPHLRAEIAPLDTRDVDQMSHRVDVRQCMLRPSLFIRNQSVSSAAGFEIGSTTCGGSLN